MPVVRILDAPVLPTSHKAPDIAPILLQVISEFKLDQKNSAGQTKLHVILRDGGMKATVNLTKFRSIWCFAHLLNRVSKLISSLSLLV
jgi:hypothetical protein